MFVELAIIFDSIKIRLHLATTGCLNVIVS
jgi:hypothetical protein